MQDVWSRRVSGPFRDDAGFSLEYAGFGVWSTSMSENKLLSRNVERFQRGLVFKAHRLLYHSTLDWRVIKKEKYLNAPAPRDLAPPGSTRGLGWGVLSWPRVPLLPFGCDRVVHLPCSLPLGGSGLQVSKRNQIQLKTRF